MQITVGLPAIPSVYDIGNRNAASNHCLCKKGYLKSLGLVIFFNPQWKRSLFNKAYKDYRVPSGT